MSTRPQPTDDDEKTGRWALFLFLASLVFHVAIFYTLHKMPEPKPAPKLIVYEIALEDPPEPEPAEPEPEPEPEIEEPEPEPEPETPPEVEPPKPPPKKLKQPPPKQQPPPSDDLPPPPKIRLPDSQLVPSGTGSPVAVNPGGTTTSPGRTQGSDKGKPGGKPKSTGQGTGGTGTAPTGPPAWAPKSDIYIKTLPKPKKQPPKVQCPASRDKGVYGTVILTLDVRRDGTIRRVNVVRGIGSGCDEIAKKALKKMLLSPAVGTDGKIADYSGLRYEYVFDPPS